MEAIIAQDTLESFLDPVDALVAECKLHMDADGYRVTAVDPANVGMVDVTLDADGFESYTADDGLIGLGLDGLTDTLGVVDGGALVNLALPDDARRLQFRAGRLERAFATIDPDSVRQEPDIPDLDLPVDAVVTGDDLDEAVSAAGLVADRITLGADAEAETLFAHADGDTDTVDVTFGAGDLVDYHFETADEGTELETSVQSMFSLDYLDDMVGVIPDGAEVRLQLGDEFPLRMEYHLADRAVDVTAMLSPRVST